jgi:hypothetical protein
LYYLSSELPNQFSIWCSLLDGAAAAQAKKHAEWDLLFDEGMPGFTQGYSEGNLFTSYARVGKSGIRPLLFRRYFHGAIPSYMEVDEEFRFYHNLAEAQNPRRLVAFDSSGREIEVVRFQQNEVSIHLKYLRQFQAGTRLHLAVYIESIRYSRSALKIIPASQRRRVRSKDMVIWRRWISKCDFMDDYETLSGVLCKAILAPPPLEGAGIWPFEEKHDKRPVSFVIGVDDEGREIEHTSAPDALNNYFGANPKAAHYLTPVFFRREVLVKYYAEPHRYKVKDGDLSCLGLWNLRMDNDRDVYVVAFLGDLGRDLPYAERLHWRQFNVAPDGKLSKTSYKRFFRAEFTDAEATDFVFRRVYRAVATEWEVNQGWPLFLAPDPGDAHLLETIRIPITESQAELDEQVGCLAKLIIDSLNERAIETCAGPFKADTKGIAKFAAFLEATQCPRAGSVVGVLRDVQAIRSAGSAHRKGVNYRKILQQGGLDQGRKSAMFQKLLERVVDALRVLRGHYCERGDAAR